MKYVNHGKEVELMSFALQICEMKNELRKKWSLTLSDGREALKGMDSDKGFQVKRFIFYVSFAINSGFSGQLP